MARGLVSIGLLLFAGCFNPHPPANVPCNELGQCPSGLQCDTHGLCVTNPDQGGGDDAPVDTPIDASIDDAPMADAKIDGMTMALDTDGDGKPDTMDNCPTKANANQHDEDGDGKGDVCDTCPHLNAAQTDSDGDGVGNACDPHPNTAGDAIARFIPFDVMPADLVQTGTWTVSGDAAHGTGTNLRLRVPTNYAKVTAEMGGNVDAISGTSRELKIVTAWTASNQWHSCGFDDTDNSSLFTFEIENENAGSTIITNAPEPTRPTKIDLGAFYIRNTMDSVAKTVSCAGLEGGSPITTNAATPAAVSGMVEAQSSRVEFSLSYIIIITSP